MIVALSVVIIFSVVLFVSASSPPAFPDQFYHRSKYAPHLPQQNLQFDEYPDSIFAAQTICYESVPWEGYPSHSGLVKGVNDTCWVSLAFDNYSTSNIDIRYETPEDWVLPYIYYSFANLVENKYQADTSDFDFAFSHWRAGGVFGIPLQKPDTLYSHLVSSLILYNPSQMVFKIWNIPLGIKAIEFKKSSMAPSSLEIIQRSLNTYWYSDGTDVRDSINAYIRLSQRCLELGEITTAASWIDSVFARNDSSFAGWLCQANVSSAQKDSAAIVDAFDRIISVYENNNDPLIDLADTTLATSNQLWASEWYAKTVFSRWYFVRGESVVIE
jgi:hypothetical protein